MENGKEKDKVIAAETAEAKGKDGNNEDSCIEESSKEKTGNEMSGKEKKQKIRKKDKKEKESEDKSEKEKSLKSFLKKNRKKLLVIVLAVLVAATGCVAVYGFTHGAVIEDSPDKIHDTSDGQIRLKVNPAITIEDGRFQEIDFHSLNSDREMQIKIRLVGAENDHYLYESPKIEAGKVLISAPVKHKYLDDINKGQSAAVAEMYSYGTDGELMNQTNYNITLVKVD